MMFQEIAPRKLHIEYTHQDPEPEDYLLVYQEGNILLRDPEALTPPHISDLFPKGTEKKFIYLFRIDQVPFFLCCVSLTDTTGLTYRKVNELRNAQPMWLAWAITLGFRLSLWYNSSRFCGKCASPMQHSRAERAMVCPSCGNTVYPVICPSVIVGIRNGERFLVTRYAASHSVFRRWALVAGYVETGETPEEAVQREVMEEVGLHVRNIRYYKSQPWPVSGALLLGYLCDLDGSSQIRIDPSELAEACWLTREEMPDRSGDISLTSEIMELFRTGKI